MRSIIIISLVAAMASTASAFPPLTNETYLEIGPLPIAELRTQVEAMQDSEKRNTLTKRTTEGLYLCDGQDFTGNCYYGAYPIGVGQCAIFTHIWHIWH